MPLRYLLRSLLLPGPPGSVQLRCPVSTVPLSPLRRVGAGNEVELTTNMLTGLISELQEDIPRALGVSKLLYAVSTKPVPVAVL